MKKILLYISSFALLYAQESLRSRLGATEFIEHMNGQVRAGYIYIENDKPSVGIGGHLHFDTKSFYDLKAAFTFETLQHFGLPHQNVDFYGEPGKSVTFVSEAKLLYSNGGFSLEAGRLMFDSPHADSDDIRMIPNYFEGIVAKFKGFTFAHISKMAGWESGGDIGKFKPLSQVIGQDQKSNGMNVIGYENDYFTLWGYNIDEVANIFYAEANVQKSGLHLGLQIDRAIDTGRRIVGDIDSLTVGAIAEYSFGDLTLSGAFNKEFGKSAPMFSFGGGPFFTSMEDQTIDAVGSKDARSYTLGCEYGYEEFGFGIMAGRFKGSGYEANEIDYYLSGSVEKFTIDAVFATIDQKYDDDYYIVRLIATYNF